MSVNADLLTNSLLVFGRNWELIFAILAFVLWGFVLTFAILKKIKDQNFTDTELITLALGGWPITALFISLLTLLLRAFIPDEIVYIVVIGFMVISAGFALRAVWRCASLYYVLTIFFILVFIHLGFTANIILPSYFDSAEHYRIIQVFLNMQEPSNLIWPTISYYHIGYHVIVAALTSITHANIGQVMLLFGQIVLAAIPFPVYFFVHRAAKSRKAAFFGIALAAFGWFMPAHAVNWGKYPALLRDRKSVV